MPTIAEQLADLDQRIADLQKSAKDLRQEIALFDKSSRQYIRLSDLLRMGEDAITKMHAQREELARHADN